jgi:hypothetical protein
VARISAHERGREGDHLAVFLSHPAPFGIVLEQVRLLPGEDLDRRVGRREPVPPVELADRGPEDAVHRGEVGGRRRPELQRGRRYRRG